MKRFLRIEFKIMILIFLMISIFLLLSGLWYLKDLLNEFNANETQVSSVTQNTSQNTVENSSENSTHSNLYKPIIEMDLKSPEKILNNIPINRSKFKSWIESNSDFVGWIKIQGTTIDSPIVQYSDNEHYLEYNALNQPDLAGSIYMDYKNKGNFYDNHTVLYGHYMKDGTIFHDLHDFKNESFFQENSLIEIQGLRESKQYKIFSVHIVSADQYYLYLDLEDTVVADEYAQHFKRLSMHKKEFDFPKEIKLLTLVTCTYEFDNARLLIHAYQMTD